jgi:hypothetical protein
MEEEKGRALSVEDYEKLREYAIALEHTRTDLWSANEDLRSKCLALEEGQMQLQDQNKELQAELEFLKNQKEKSA